MSVDASSELAAVDLYGAELVRVAELDRSVRPLRALDEHGEELPLALERYLGHAAVDEHGVLERALGPVLDIGCGPGRHVVALGQRGVAAVGLDISPLAVRLARRRGASVIEGSIFSRVPRAGSWGSALLLDGNIGIGGAPAQLLARVGLLLRPGGLVLVEIEGPDVRARTLRVRLISAETSSPCFPWARVGIDDLAAIAARSGFRVSEHWREGERWFAALASVEGDQAA